MEPYKEHTVTAEELQNYMHLEPLIRGVFQNYKMERMMELLEKALGHPAMVIDMGFKIIDETPSITEAYHLHIKNNTFPLESCIELIKTNHIYKNVSGRSYSSAFIPHPEFQNFILATLRATGIDVMLLLVFENGKPFDASDFDCIKKVSQIMAVQYQKADITFNSDRMVLPNHLIFSLLNGETVTRQEILTRGSHYPWISHKKLYFMIIDDKKEHADISFRFLSILPALRSFLPAEYCMTYRSQIISLLGPEQFHELYAGQREAFEQFLDAHQLCCAISPEYDDILNSRIYYMCTQNLMQIIRQHRLTVAYFPDMHFHVVYDLITSKYPLEVFIHPAIRLLQEYDAENDSNLLSTLEVYLKHKSNPDLAADLLYIHRSTLFYRIKKIRELTGYPLENMDETSEIYFSLQLSRIRQKYDKD